MGLGGDDILGADADSGQVIHGGGLQIALKDAGQAKGGGQTLLDSVGGDGGVLFGARLDAVIVIIGLHIIGGDFLGGHAHERFQHGAGETGPILALFAVHQNA